MKCGYAQAGVCVTTPTRKVSLVPVAFAAAFAFGTALGGAHSASTGDWTRYGLHTNEDRNSPLTQINDENVTGLGLEWYLDMPDRSALEATPLEVGGILYVSGGFGAVRAVDAKRGTELWSYDPRANEADPRGARRMYASNRGIAYWNGKIYVCTKDGRMVALDAKSGNVVWSTVFLAPNTNSTSTGAPRAMNGKIVIGSSGSEFSGRGTVTAVDAETGKIAWRFFVVPGDPAKGFEDDTQAMAAKTWTGEWWKFGGGGNPWNAITYDDELGRVYIGTGNAGPWLGKVRTDGKNFDNLFTASIVALEANTGKYIWHYQTTPADVWDYDAVGDIILAHFKVKGKSRPVLMQANKNGFFYVIDRVTGKLISAEKFSRANWAERVDLKTGRPVETVGSRYLKDRITIYPGMYGAHDWQAMSYNSISGLAYIPAIRIGATYAPSEEAEATLHRSMGRIQSSQGVDSIPLAGTLDGPGKRGSLIAWDPRRQVAKWQIDFPVEFNGGTLTTHGNLVFQGLSDGQLVAYAADSGRKLWSFDAKLGVMAPPMTYEVDGKQYVSVLVGYGAGGGETDVLGNRGWKYGVHPRRLLTFALHGSASLPETPPPQYHVDLLDDPSLQPDAMRVKTGGILFDQLCAGCHGGNVIANGGAPDLRASAVALSHDAFATILGKGLLVSQGMPQFDDLSGEEVTSLYEFIRTRAREDQAAAAKH